MAETPTKKFRVPDALWDSAKAKATREGTDLSTLIREFLAAYITTDQEQGS